MATIEEINADRIKFIGKAKENIETELNKVGFSIININNADISDDANYIKVRKLQLKLRLTLQKRKEIFRLQKPT